MIKNIFKKREEKIVSDIQAYWALLLKAEVAGGIKAAIAKQAAKLAVAAPEKSYAGVNRLAAIKDAHKQLEALSIEEATEAEMEALTDIVVRLGKTEEQMIKDTVRLKKLCGDAEQRLSLPVKIVAMQQAKADFLLAEAALKAAQITYQANKDVWDQASNGVNMQGVELLIGDDPAYKAVRNLYKM